MTVDSPSSDAFGSSAPNGGARSSKGLHSADVRLARAIAKGDRDAAAELIERLQGRTRNLVRYLVRGDQDVDDFAQNALMEVLRSVHTYRGVASLEHWSSRIVTRHVRAALARRARYESQKQDIGPSLRLLRPSRSEYGARRDVARALDGLPDAQREALVLFHVVGMTLKEVAKETGVAENTAKSRIRLAMDKVRGALASAG
ncbi:MAG: RNA polymerase sigma factor [Myxococcota bacterium]